MLKTEATAVSLQLGEQLTRAALYTWGRLRLVACGLIVMVNTVAFVLPSYQFLVPMRGYEAFLSALLFQAGSGFWGWMSFLVGSGWFANPLFLAGTLLLLRGRVVSATIFGLAALALAIESGLFANSSDVPLLLGYYVWVGSIGALVVASLLFWRLRPTHAA